MARKRKQTIIEAFKPPPYRWWFLGIMGGLFTLMLFTLFIQFIASNAWRGLSLKITIGLSFLLSVWFFYIVNYNHSTLELLHRRYYKWMLYLFTPLVIYFMSHMAIVYGVGNLASRLSNKPQTMLDVVEKHYIETRKGCKTRLVSKILQEAVPPNICVSQSDFDRFPQLIAIKISGRQSYFGFHIDEIQYDWAKTATLNQAESIKP